LAPALLLLAASSARSAVIHFEIARCNGVTISGFTITRGNGAPGAGIRIRKCQLVAVTDNVITGNQSSGDGGGIGVVAGNIVITNNQITNNSSYLGATLDGGGIYAYYITATISGNRFEGNMGHEGGAIIINAATGPGLTIYGNRFLNNHATLLGGGVYANHGTAPTITSNTFVANNAVEAGGGIWYTSQSVPTIRQNIVVNNSAQTGGGIDQYERGASPTISCNDVWNNIGGNYGGYIADQTGSNGNISSDPLFCASGDYTISSMSPCAPTNSQGCGLIGAFGVGCDAAHATPTAAARPASWGAIKALYQR
jgi:hypothetical protein